MKRIVQWSLIFVMIAVTSFGATLLVARGAQLALMFGVPPKNVEATQLAQTEVATLGRSSAETLSSAYTAREPAPADPEPDQAAADPQSAQTEDLSAVGAIEVKDDRQVVLGSSGRVEAVLVEQGDRVSAGELLISLDTTYLDWAVEQAEIGFETARINFEELGEEIEESDIELARAALLQAQEDYAEVEAGPTEEELAAAESAAAAAWAQYKEVQEQPTPAQVNSALASLRKAEITVQQAQREFDKIAWLPEAAATDAADNLQRATVDLEAAKAAYEEASKPATEAELQSALSSAQSAQDRLNQLKEMPTAANLAAASAEVLAAETALAKLEEGPKESELRKSELDVRQAMIGLEQARLARQYAEVKAPIDGVVLAVNLDVGQQASAGAVAATLADTENLRLVVNVEQKDISKVEAGQDVAISVFALPQEQFAGTVDRIAPTANSGTGFVTFPVVIVMTEGPLERLLPGMTASAVFARMTSAQQSDTEDTATDAADDGGDSGGAGGAVEPQEDSENPSIDAAETDTDNN